MKIKKLISGISALAVAASAFAGFAVTANAEEYLKLDYETSGAASDWTSPNGSVSLQTNADAAINNYVQIAQSGGDSRNGYYNFPSGAQKDGEVVLEFDFYLRATDQRSTQLFVYGQGVTGANNDARTSGYVLRYDQPINGGDFAVNMTGGSKTMTASEISDIPNKTSGYTSGTWVHSKAILDFDAHTAEVLVTSLDGETQYYKGKLDMDKSVTALGGINLLAPRNGGNIGIDNIVVRDKDDSDVSEVYYTVTYDIQGNTSSESVLSNGKVAAVPDTYKGGYTFKGWAKDDDTETLYTTDEIKDMVISADTKLTAQYDVDAAYVEAIKSVSITGADKMTFGPDPDTAESNPYTVVINGADGTTITEENLSSNVNDFNVTWDIGGFKTESDQEGQYCDSYGAFSVNNEGKVATSFELKNVPMNFIGMMTATVTYNGETYVGKKAVVALGNITVPTSQILPEGGYPSDYDAYPDSFEGYTSKNDTYGAVYDAALGNWVMSGSDTATAVIMNEDGNKFVRITANTLKKSHMFTNSIDSPATQAIFEQNVRFNSNGGTITLSSKYPIWGNGYVCPVAVKYNSSEVTLNDVPITDSADAKAVVTSGTWYKLVLSVDKTTQSAFVKLYDMEGNYVGGAENVAWTEDNTPTFYSIGLTNETTGTIDFDNYKAYYPTADENAYTLTASQDTLSIPNKDTADLVASLKTEDGYDITGAATWTVLEEDMREGVIVTPDEADSHKAKVTLGEGASAGEATVQVNIGGYTKTIKLNITSSAESVKFTKSSTSVSIPLNDTPITAEYAAIVVNGEGADLERDVTLAVYDKNNTSAYTLPDGITFENGVLTVTKTAPAVTFTIRATGKNTDNEDISKSIKVTVHGLSFDFGAGTEDDLAEGFTAVTPDTSYTEARGYGIASGSVTAGGTASTEDAAADYLEGAMTFKADVEKGKNYTVEITYAGEVRTGYINSDLAGYPLETTDNYGTAAAYAELTTKTYTVAVPTDTLDLIISGSGAKIAAVTITKNADKAPNAKPDIHHVGDSTAANSGSWAYYIDHNRSQFPTLEALATLYNNGAGGRNLCTYYTQGKLGGVLKAIEPGDIVMFGNNGTNGLGSFFEEDVNFYLDAAEAMGAKIIINSYTPHGAKGNYAYVYNSETNTFSGWRQDSGDPTTRKVADERAASDPNYLGFVEIGKNADAAFNAYVADYAKNNYASADAAAQAIIACFGDHNHYSDGSIARDLMLNGYGETKGIVEQIVAILSGETPTPVTTYTVTFKAEGAADITRTVEAGKTVADIPAVPEKTGYTGKWMIGEDEFTTETVINADTEVTASYTADSVTTYTVTFKAEGAADITRTVEAGKTVADIPAVPEKTGYTGKWMIGEDEFTAETVINADTEVTAAYTVIPVVEKKVEVTSKSLENGKLTATISNTTGEAVYITAMVAVYGENGQLVSVKFDTVTVEANDDATAEVENTASGNSIKAFIWNMTDSMIPLTDVITPAE